MMALAYLLPALDLGFHSREDALKEEGLVGGVLLRLWCGLGLPDAGAADAAEAVGDEGVVRGAAGGVPGEGVARRRWSGAVRDDRGGGAPPGRGGDGEDRGADQLPARATDAAVAGVRRQGRRRGDDRRRPRGVHRRGPQDARDLPVARLLRRGRRRRRPRRLDQRRRPPPGRRPGLGPPRRPPDLRRLLRAIPRVRNRRTPRRHGHPTRPLRSPILQGRTRRPLPGLSTPLRALRGTPSPRRKSRRRGGRGQQRASVALFCE
mmetsp:Transcript_10578/g.34953  ORF Transcript_10578/g.34953 Transcript_10578/m.34953 type:complete len:263 (+) Transcript_10578:2668-3456(+)